MLLRYSKLISFLLILFFSSTLYAEDILIIHQNYGNTHSKHKNRLENAGHTVTMQNTSSSYSYTAANYDQVYDIRYSYTSYSTADIDRFKTVLSNGGTVYLVGENGNFDSRNDAIVSFLQRSLRYTIAIRNSKFQSNAFEKVSSPQQSFDQFSRHRDL